MMAFSASQALPTLPPVRGSQHGMLMQHKLLLASPYAAHLQLSARRSGCCSFSKSLLPQLFGPKQQQQTQPDKPTSLLDSVDGWEEQASTYSSLLQQAEDITFNCSSAHRSMLEDAERMLVLCVEERPQHLQPRVLLLRNLMRQSEGREGDVPALALQALQDADLPRADASMMRHLHVLQIVMLAIKAIYKVKEESDLTSSSVKSPGPSVKAFLAAAKAAAPSYASEFDKLALRVQRQLVCCEEEQRLALLGDRDGYMSSVDLSAVHGGHHAVVAQGAVVDGV